MNQLHNPRGAVAKSLPSAPAEALASVRYRLATARTLGRLATVARDADETARLLEANSGAAAEKCRELAATRGLVPTA